MFYTVIKNASGTVIGAGEYTSEPKTLQTGETACDSAAYASALTTVMTQTLAQQAGAALALARAHVNNNYLFLAETPPADWVAYQKALIAIMTGKDTTSTKLPEKPSV